MHCHLNRYLEIAERKQWVCYLGLVDNTIVTMKQRTLLTQQKY